ncbi:hypothetical protein HK102_011263 [Quaeritorhiza haematococci]|nr:hypothetical protein HK102_011263 [Quaeritorhiza haematococci]
MTCAACGASSRRSRLIDLRIHLQGPTSTILHDYISSSYANFQFDLRAFVHNTLKQPYLLATTQPIERFKVLETLCFACTTLPPSEVFRAFLDERVVRMMVRDLKGLETKGDVGALELFDGILQRLVALIVEESGGPKSENRRCALRILTDLTEESVVEFCSWSKTIRRGPRKSLVDLLNKNWVGFPLADGGIPILRVISTTLLDLTKRYSGKTESRNLDFSTPEGGLLDFVSSLEDQDIPHVKVVDTLQKRFTKALGKMSGKQCLLYQTLIYMAAKRLGGEVYVKWIKDLISTESGMTKRESQFYLNTLQKSLEFTPTEMLKVHARLFGTNPKYRDYTQLIRARLAELGEKLKADAFSPGTAAKLDLASIVQEFKVSGVISQALLQASIFQGKWFNSTFLPTLLGLRPMPAGIDHNARTRLIESLHKAKKIPAALHEAYKGRSGTSSMMQSEIQQPEKQILADSSSAEQQNSARAAKRLISEISDIRAHLLKIVEDQRPNSATLRNETEYLKQKRSLIVTLIRQYQTGSEARCSYEGDVTLDERTGELDFAGIAIERMDVEIVDQLLHMVQILHVLEAKFEQIAPGPLSNEKEGVMQFIVSLVDACIDGEKLGGTPPLKNALLLRLVSLTYGDGISQALCFTVARALHVLADYGAFNTVLGMSGLRYGLLEGIFSK